MNLYGRITVFIVLLTLITVMGHFWWRISLFSLIPWPILLSLILPYLTSHPRRWLLFISFTAELFSTLPPGAMTIIVFVPYILTFLPTRPETGFNLKFFGWMIFMTCIQYLLLLIATLQLAWPRALGYMMLATSLVAFGSIAVWYEAIEPYRRPRTMPRFKHR